MLQGCILSSVNQKKKKSSRHDNFRLHQCHHTIGVWNIGCISHVLLPPPPQMKWNEVVKPANMANII